MTLLHKEPRVTYGMGFFTTMQLMMQRMPQLRKSLSCRILSTVHPYQTI